MQQARDLMLSAARPETVRAGVDMAVAAGLGAMRDGDTFRFSTAVMDRLPVVLRVLARCGALLRGGVEGADFIDVKLGSPRLAFISCADASARLPIVSERTRVDLGRARAAVEQPEGMVVYLKGSVASLRVWTDLLHVGAWRDGDRRPR
jgi:hypothetical protein